MCTAVRFCDASLPWGPCRRPAALLNLSTRRLAGSAWSCNRPPARRCCRSIPAAGFPPTAAPAKCTHDLAPSFASCQHDISPSPASCGYFADAHPTRSSNRQPAPRVPAGERIAIENCPARHLDLWLVLPAACAARLATSRAGTAPCGVAEGTLCIPSWLQPVLQQVVGWLCCRPLCHRHPMCPCHPIPAAQVPGKGKGLQGGLPPGQAKKCEDAQGKAAQAEGKKRHLQSA